MEASSAQESKAGRPWHSFAAARWPWILLILLTALGYYGSYYRHSLNFRDEGGTVALLAKRLLEGERPFLDVVLGYNVLWFYPVVVLFKLFGVSFVVLRVYCFALATLTAVLGFLTVWKACSARDESAPTPWRGLFAFAVALLPLLVPGMTFKNYMPLLAVANSFALLHVALAPVGSREALWKSVAGGVVLGLTLLIRVDVGLFCTVLWIGLHGLRLLEREAAFPRRLLAGIGSSVLVLLVAAAVHVPVWMDAKRRGFDRQFTAQDSAWVGSLGHALSFRVAAPPKAAPKALAEKAAPVAAEAAVPVPKHSWNREILKRNAWRDFTHAKDAEARALTILTYAPILSLLPLIFLSLVQFALAVYSGLAGDNRRPLGALVVLGGALTTFPQFFFFRPDSPHLSEFSPGFWVAIGSCVMLLGLYRAARSGRSRWITRLFLAFLLLHAVLHLWRMMPDRWTGTIAARKGRTKYFQAENGVNVYVSSREQKGLEPLRKLIQSRSQPGEYLVAYPYHPAINLLADRPTYEKNVYIDNATRSKNWDAEAIARFKKFRPAIIVISEWDINGTDASRFSLWATATKTWVQTHYVYQGTYLEFEVYTRPDSGPT